MIFNDFGFLFIFIPAVIFLFYCPFFRNFREITLVASSLVFYGVSGIEHALVLVFDMVWVYAITRLPGFVGNRLLLAVAAVPPALALVYYKYLTFILTSVGVARPAGSLSEDTFQGLDLLWDIALPAGVSFFTFQVISYAVDRYRGQIQQPPSPQRFAVYITFFPQLVAGPIVRYEQVSDALERLRRFVPSAAQIYTGIVYLVGGLAMKVLIADTLARQLAPLVADPESLAQDAAAFLVLGYSFQIYFDFYGYSLAAIGLGLMFGIRLPFNFLQPYSSLTPKEFWRRWHVTLSYWIRDYLYRPLGGNRHYIRNIVIVFALCGLWHGAGWTFVIWGLYHGLLVAGYRLAAPVWDRLPNALQWGLTFTAVSVGWLLFVFDFEGIRQFGDALAAPGDLGTDWQAWAAVAVAAAVCFGLKLETIAEAPPRNAVRAVSLALGTTAVAVAVLMFVSVSDSFIYFRF
jgi:alginate O-acetyltransferase complex protein AlgI